MRAATRLSQVPVSFWAEVKEIITNLQAKGMDIIRIDVGDPDLPPTEEIIQALISAVHEPEGHRYPGGTGLAPLRQAIAGYYARRFGVTLDPDREVLPLIGSKEGIAHVALGSGAVVRAIDTSSITPPETVARVVAVARAHRLPVSVGTTNGGNDGSVFSRYGSIVVPLSWPGRYSHSPVEVVDSRDLDALAGLLAALAQEF